MQRSHSLFNGKRFIGDKIVKVFHDSFFGSQPEDTDGCQINDLPPEDIQTFDPDTPLEAILKGFAPCPKCLWPRQGFRE
jgi:hypothetical protein